MYSIHLSRVVSLFNLFMKFTDFLFSLVGAFPFSAGRSRTSVLQSFILNSWQFPQARVLWNWSKSRRRIITIRFRGQAP
jgi:hypothetical protein